MSTEKILPILKAQQADPTQALDASLMTTKEPLKVVVTGPDDKPMEVKLYLVKVNGTYFITNFHDDEDVYVRKDNTQKPTFEEILQKVSEKYLADGAKIELDGGGEVGIGNLGNILLRVSYLKEGETSPVEDVIVVKAGDKDTAFSKARQLDKQVIKVKEPEQKKGTSEVPRPHEVPNGGLRVVQDEVRSNPGDWVGSQASTTNGKVNVPVQISDADIKKIVQDAANAHKAELLPYIGDYNNDGVIDDKDLAAALADPNNDKDGDLIPDFMEMYDPWFRQITDPSRNDKDAIFGAGKDADGDGVDNLTEMAEGKNPNDPTDNKVVSDVRTTTQKVTFTGTQATRDGFSGLTTGGTITADAEYEIGADGSVTTKTQPKITFQDTPDVARWSQLMWGGDARVRYSLYGDGKLTLGHGAGFHMWNRSYLDDSFGFDPANPWRLDVNLAELNWNINPDNTLTFGGGFTYGNPFSNAYLKLGTAHNLGSGWELDWATKLYLWRQTNPTLDQRLTGTTHVEETTTRTFTTQGGVHGQTYTGQADFPVDSTMTGSIPNGNDLNWDLSLRLKKTWLLDNGAYLQGVINPVVSRYNLFGAEWPMHLIAGFGGYNFGPDGVKFDLGAFGRYSLYDAFSDDKSMRHGGMLNPFFNIHIADKVHISAQYWLLAQKEGSLDLAKSQGGSLEVKYDALPWMSPYIKYQGDEHYQLIPELYGLEGPANHMGLVGVEFRIPTKSADHKLTADLHGGYGTESSVLGGGKVDYAGRSGTTTYGVSVGTEYTGSNIADVSTANAEDPTKLLAYGEEKVTARTISKEAKAGIIERLKILAFIKDYIFILDNMPDQRNTDSADTDVAAKAKEMVKFIEYIKGLDESYFADLKLNEEGLDGEVLAQVQAFNGLSATDKKTGIVYLFNYYKYKGLLEVNDNTDDIRGVQVNDVLLTWMAALVMGKIAEKEQGEITKTAALSMGYNPEKLGDSEKAAVAKELQKVYFDEEAKNIDHYMENTATNMSLVEKAAKEFLTSQVGKADEAIDKADLLLKDIMLDADWHVGIIKEDVDFFALILKYINAKVKDLPTLQALIAKLKEVESKLEPFKTHEVISKILAKITQTRETAEKMEAAWSKLIDVNALIVRIDEATKANITTDTKAMYTELKKLVYGEWVSGNLVGGLMQLIPDYLSAIGKKVDTVKLPDDTAERPIKGFYATLTPNDVFEKMNYITLKDDGRKHTRLVMDDPNTSILLAPFADAPNNLVKKLLDPYLGSGKNSKITTLGITVSDDDIQRIESSARFYSLISTNAVQLPGAMMDLMNNYLRFNYLRMELLPEEASSDPVDVNLFALVYIAEKETGSILSKGQISTVKYVINNLAEMPIVGWDKRLRLAIAAAGGSKPKIQAALKKLIKAFRAEAKKYTKTIGAQVDRKILNKVIDYLEALTR